MSIDMKKRKRIAILFGGRSAEHEVSLQSAQNVIAALDQEKYEAVLIGIDKDGKWYYHGERIQLMHADDPKRITFIYLRIKGSILSDAPSSTNRGRDKRGPPTVNIKAAAKTIKSECSAALFASLYFSAPMNLATSELLPAPTPAAIAIIMLCTVKAIPIAPKSRFHRCPLKN